MKPTMVTIAPAQPDTDLEVLVERDPALPCQVTKRGERTCDRAADWVVSVRCAIHGASTGLVCEPCRVTYIPRMQAKGHGSCRGPWHIVRIEPLR